MSAKKIKVKTAFALSNQIKDKIAKALQSVLGSEVPCVFEQEEELMAGAYIEVDSLVLQLNLRDELKFFERVSVND